MDSGQIDEGQLRPEALGELALRLSKERCGGPYRLESGMLVAVEGIDGSGVSTTSRALARAFSGLIESGRVCYTKEPTNGPVGHLIVEVLDGLIEGLESPQALALLFAADRMWHLTSKPLAGRRGLLECLRDGYLIVTDRYKYSSLAYQSTPGRVGARRVPGAPGEWLHVINSYAPPAHVLVYVDTPPEVASARLSKSRWNTQLYEDSARLEEVGSAFERLLRRLEEEPEAPPDGGEPWVGLLEAWGLDAQRLYPEPLRYPAIIRLSGAGRPSENVARAACWILDLAARAGMARG